MLFWILAFLNWSIIIVYIIWLWNDYIKGDEDK